MQKKIFVRRKHIKEAEKLRNFGFSNRRCESCPVALALKDAGFKEVQVSSQQWSFLNDVNDAARIVGTFSRKVTAFIHRADYYEEVKPFSFIARYWVN